MTAKPATTSSANPVRRFRLFVARRASRSAPFGLSDDEEGIGHSVLTLTRTVHDLAGDPHLGGLASIQIHRLRAAQADEVLREFGELHAHGKAGLPAIHSHQIEMRRAPTYGRAG